MGKTPADKDPCTDAHDKTGQAARSDIPPLPVGPRPDRRGRVSSPRGRRPEAICWVIPAKMTITGTMKLPPPTPIIPEMNPVRAPKRTRTIQRTQMGGTPTMT